MKYISHRHQLCLELTFGPFCISWISITANISVLMPQLLTYLFLHVQHELLKNQILCSCYLGIPVGASFTEIIHEIFIWLICAGIFEELLSGSSRKRMERTVPLFISEISVWLLWLDMEAKLIGCRQIMCRLFYCCFFLPRNNFSLQIHSDLQ